MKSYSYEWWWFVIVSFFICPSSLVWDNNANTQSQGGRSSSMNDTGGGMFLIGVTASFYSIANDYYEPKTSVTDTVRFLFLLVTFTTTTMV